MKKTLFRPIENEETAIEEEEELDDSCQVSKEVEISVMCSCVAQWLSIALAAQKIVGSIPREYTY